MLPQPGRQAAVGSPAHSEAGPEAAGSSASEAGNSLPGNASRIIHVVLGITIMPSEVKG